jgi:hypothetical protein
VLVCNVSQLARRAAIAADLAEAAAALDTPGTGNVVFATLVDDPASVGDHVDAFLGQIMLEAANASSTVNAGLVYRVAVDEAAVASSAQSASVPTVWSAAVVETASAIDLIDVRVPIVFNYQMLETANANSMQDAELIAIRPARIATVSGLEPVLVDFTLAGVRQLRSGTRVGSPRVPSNYGASLFESAAASSTFSAEGGSEILVGDGTSNLSGNGQFTDGSFYVAIPYSPFGITSTGTWVGTLSVEYSFSGPSGPWTVSEIHTSNFSGLWSSYLSPFWVRVGFEAGQYTSGTAHVQLLHKP